jgi:hypothetical protein
MLLAGARTFRLSAAIFDVLQIILSSRLHRTHLHARKSKVRRGSIGRGKAVAALGENARVVFRMCNPEGTAGGTCSFAIALRAMDNLMSVGGRQLPPSVSEERAEGPKREQGRERAVTPARSHIRQ